MRTRTPGLHFERCSSCPISIRRAPSALSALISPSVAPRRLLSIEKLVERRLPAFGLESMFPADDTTEAEHSPSELQAPIVAPLPGQMPRIRQGLCLIVVRSPPPCRSGLECPPWVAGCLLEWVRAKSAGPQIAADLARRQFSAAWARRQDHHVRRPCRRNSRRPWRTHFRRWPRPTSGSAISSRRKRWSARFPLPAPRRRRRRTPGNA
jgi:hypothetical protein